MAKETRLPWLPTVANQLVNVNNILSQGVAQIVGAGALNILDGKVQNQIVHQTVDDLTDATVIADATTTLTAQSLDSTNRKKTIMPLGKALTQAQYEVLVQDQDQQALINSQIPEYALRQNQKYLIPTVQALFKSGGALLSTHYIDGTAVSDGKLTPQLIFDSSVNALGENYSNLTVAIMHSQTYNSIRKRGLTDSINGSELGAQIAFNGVIPTIGGLRISINDTLCAPDTSGDADVYPVYLFGNQSVVLEVTTDLYLLEDTNILKGMGSTDYAYYWRIAPYVRNITWNGANTGATSIADLGTATNWALVDSKEKNVFVTKIDTVL